MTPNSFLTPEEREIFSRATVGIAGAGGLGSNCAMHLVRSGLRRFVIADFDDVAESNLNRQFFFADQVGQKKVEALEENLRRITPDLDLELHHIRIDARNAVTLFASCDIVVEAFDAGAEKQMLIRALIGAGKDVVAASGLAGWGRSNLLKLRRIGGGRLHLIGDTESGVETAPPFSPRVGIAAAMEANTVIALLLGLEP